MYLKNLLLLSSAGIGLISPAALLKFVDSESTVLPEPLLDPGDFIEDREEPEDSPVVSLPDPVPAPSLPQVVEEVDEEINYGFLPEEDANPAIVPKKPEKNYSSKRSPSNNVGFHLTPLNGGEEYFVNPLTDQLDFTLWFEGYKSAYRNFKREEVRISLFKSPAWDNASEEDEYSEIPSDKTLSLFDEGLDEIKLKQLLLSLNTRRHWKKWHGNRNFWSDNGTTRAQSISDLGDLKIKYFQDFESLREYVKAKVSSCTGERRACYAKEEELGMMDQDVFSFYQST